MAYCDPIEGVWHEIAAEHWELREKSALVSMEEEGVVSHAPE